ncbi:uncharacterized protein LOC143299854 [Babylonia areolata]|uniref:uncharacterized protein LOC143299854 n=1 Tax=Babylonia areolata TaxID=304850 RepID=UPI003FD3BCFA
MEAGSKDMILFPRADSADSSSWADGGQGTSPWPVWASRPGDTGIHVNTTFSSVYDSVNATMPPSPDAVLSGIHIFSVILGTSLTVMTIYLAWKAWHARYYCTTTCEPEDRQEHVTDPLTHARSCRRKGAALTGACCWACGCQWCVVKDRRQDWDSINTSGELYQTQSTSGNRSSLDRLADFFNGSVPSDVSYLNCSQQSVTTTHGRPQWRDRSQAYDPSHSHPHGGRDPQRRRASTWSAPAHRGAVTGKPGHQQNAPTALNSNSPARCGVEGERIPPGPVCDPVVDRRRKGKKEEGKEGEEDSLLDTDQYSEDSTLLQHALHAVTLRPTSSDSADPGMTRGAFPSNPADPRMTRGPTTSDLADPVMTQGLTPSHPGQGEVNKGAHRSTGTLPRPQLPTSSIPGVGGDKGDAAPRAGDVGDDAGHGNGRAAHRQTANVDSLVSCLELSSKTGYSAGTDADRYITINTTYSEADCDVTMNRTYDEDDCDDTMNRTCIEIDPDVTIDRTYTKANRDVTIDRTYTKADRHVTINMTDSEADCDVTMNRTYDEDDCDDTMNRTCIEIDPDVIIDRTYTKAVSDVTIDTTYTKADHDVTTNTTYSEADHDVAINTTYSEADRDVTTNTAHSEADFALPCEVSMMNRTYVCAHSFLSGSRPDPGHSLLGVRVKVKVDGSGQYSRRAERPSVDGGCVSGTTGTDSPRRATNSVPAHTRARDESSWCGAATRHDTVPEAREATPQILRQHSDGSVASKQMMVLVVKVSRALKM